MDGLQDVLFRIAENEEDGRHLVALRSIPAGRAIFSECPLATGPALDAASDDICIVCLRYLRRSAVCGRCFWPVCSSECGRTQRHKAECNVLSACARQSEDEILPVRHLLVLRCLLFKNKDSYAWEKLMELEDHHGIQTLVRSVEEELEDADRCDLRTFIEENCGIGNVDVDTVADIVISSAIDIDCDKSDTPSSTGLYLTGSLLSHSCVPNTRVAFSDQESNFAMTVFAAVEIKRGEKITFCNGLGGAEGSLIRTGTRERRRRLRKRLIDCCCDRCVDPAELDTYVSGLLCQRCIGQFTNTKKCPLLPADPVDHAGSKWVCGECGYQVRADFAAALEEKLLKELEEDRGEDEHVKLKDFLLTNSAILHPNHFLMTTCKWRLFSMASSIHQSNGAASASEGISIADKMEAAEHGMEMLKLCDKLHPGLSVERGAILLSMATMLQQTLSQEIMNRISHSESSDDSDPESPGCGGELSERQVYAIFRDSQFCFEEAKKVQRLDKTPRGKEVYAGIKSSIHLLNDMKKEFERSYLKVRKKSRE